MSDDRREPIPDDVMHELVRQFEEDRRAEMAPPAGASSPIPAKHVGNSPDMREILRRHGPALDGQAPPDEQIDMWPEDIGGEDPVDAFYRERGGGRPATMAQELTRLAGVMRACASPEETRGLIGVARRARIADLKESHRDRLLELRGEPDRERDREYVPTFLHRQPRCHGLPLVEAHTAWASDEHQSRWDLSDIGDDCWLVQRRKGTGPWKGMGIWLPPLRLGLGGWMREVDELAERHREEPTEGELMEVYGEH